MRSHIERCPSQHWYTILHQGISLATLSQRWLRPNSSTGDNMIVRARKPFNRGSNVSELACFESKDQLVIVYQN
jgi:hypothetical protein